MQLEAEQKLGQGCLVVVLGDLDRPLPTPESTVPGKGVAWMHEKCGGAGQ